MGSYRWPVARRTGSRSSVVGSDTLRAEVIMTLNHRSEPPTEPIGLLSEVLAIAVLEITTGASAVRSQCFVSDNSPSQSVNLLRKCAGYLLLAQASQRLDPTARGSSNLTGERPDFLARPGLGNAEDPLLLLERLSIYVQVLNSLRFHEILPVRPHRFTVPPPDRLPSTVSPFTVPITVWLRESARALPL